ncbi:hypothetical protein D3C85_501050 [compost metagenome]
MGVDELRQHRQHEHQRLGVADVHQKTTEHQGHRLADLAQRRVIAHIAGQRTPLLDREVNQIRHAKPFDGVERRGRRRENGADTGTDDGDLQSQAQLQAQGVPVAAPEAVLQTAGHRRNGAGTGRQADHPAGGKKRQPCLKLHCTPRLRLVTDV